MLQGRAIYLIIPGKRIKSVLASQSMSQLPFFSKGSLLFWILCFFSLRLLLFWFHNEPREIPFVPKPVSACQARFLNHIFYLYVMETREDRIYYWGKKPGKCSPHALKWAKDWKKKSNNAGKLDLSEYLTFYSPLKWKLWGSISRHHTTGGWPHILGCLTVHFMLHGLLAT